MDPRLFFCVSGRAGILRFSRLWDESEGLTLIDRLSCCAGSAETGQTRLLVMVSRAQTELLVISTRSPSSLEFGLLDKGTSNSIRPPRLDLLTESRKYVRNRLLPAS
jgi:hypothetical protein